MNKKIYRPDNKALIAEAHENLVKRIRNILPYLRDDTSLDSKFKINLLRDIVELACAIPLETWDRPDMKSLPDNLGNVVDLINHISSKSISVEYALVIIEQGVDVLAKDTLSNIKEVARLKTNFCNFVDDDRILSAALIRLAKRFPVSNASEAGKLLNLLVLLSLEAQSLESPIFTIDEIEMITEVLGRVDHDRKKPRIVISADNAHRALITKWNKIPKKEDASLMHDGESLYLFDANEGVQLSIPHRDVPDMHCGIIKTLTNWKGMSGIRHYAALLRLFSVEGGRQGCIRWTIDDHLDALGYSKRSREKPELRGNIAREVELLTKLELCIYDKNGSERERAPILLSTSKYEKLLGSIWNLEGMELIINRHLYRGVRNTDTGKIGLNWFPAPIELAKINHVIFPHSIVLGLLLPVHWRLSMNDGLLYINITGEKLLNLAGIEYDSRRASVAWDKLNSSLNELKIIDCVDRWEWREGTEELGNVCIIYPPDWALDPFRGIRMIEGMPFEPILTGRELLIYRMKRGITQDRMADILNVSTSSIARAESSSRSDMLLSRSLRRNIKKYLFGIGDVI